MLCDPTALPAEARRWIVSTGVRFSHLAVGAHASTLAIAQQPVHHPMKFEGTSSYVATNDLKIAVNAAIRLERPLLIKGEPGTGKSVLAAEVARPSMRR